MAVPRRHNSHLNATAIRTIKLRSFNLYCGPTVSQHVRNIKQMINHKIWQYAPNLKKQFWNEKTFWSDGYFACSVGNASAGTIRKYIQEQG